MTRQEFRIRRFTSNCKMMLQSVGIVLALAAVMIGAPLGLLWIGVRVIRSAWGH